MSGSFRALEWNRNIRLTAKMHVVRSAIDELLTNAALHEADFEGPREVVPAKHVAIVTCMDSRHTSSVRSPTSMWPFVPRWRVSANIRIFRIAIAFAASSIRWKTVTCAR